MLFLEMEDPDADIMLYINSPGGSVYAGMAIYDTMKYLKCDVSTVCIGMAASMGAFLLAAGAKGKRKALPNAEIMIHQVSSGAQGQATDIQIHAEQISQDQEKAQRGAGQEHGQAPGGSEPGRGAGPLPHRPGGQGIRHHRRDHPAAPVIARNKGAIHGK